MTGRNGRALRFVVVALVAAGATACTPQPGAKLASDVDAAKKEHTPEVLIERGKAFASVGDFTRAEQYLAAALEEGADPAVALPLLLRSCIAEQRYRVALNYAEPYLKRRPDDYKLRFVVGSLYATIGETKAARGELEELARVKPDYAEVHFALGVLLRDDEQDAAGADAQFREYLRLQPEGSHAPEARGFLLRTLP